MITRKITKEGYIVLKIGSKWHFEHDLIAERILNRKLSVLEVIHHINEKKSDNRKENLDLFETQNLHQKFHLKKKQFGLTRPIIFEQTYRLLENVAKREQSAIKPIFLHHVES
jgi:hypothetical protein